MTDDIEIWLPFPGWGDRYDISSHGRLRGYVWGWKKLSPPRLIKTIKDKKTGYHKIMLHRGKEIKSTHMHRAVLIAFKGPPPFEKAEACHNDGDRDNNRLSNLRWDTKRNNLNDMVKHGTIRRGAQINMTKLNESQVIKIREMHSAGISNLKISNEFNCCNTTIWNIIHMVTWKHISQN